MKKASDPLGLKGKTIKEFHESADGEILSPREPVEPELQVSVRDKGRGKAGILEISEKDFSPLGESASEEFLEEVVIPDREKRSLPPSKRNKGRIDFGRRGERPRRDDEMKTGFEGDLEEYGERSVFF